jgi:hypothetical protein
MTTTFGGRVTKDQANKLFRNRLKIRTRSIDKIAETALRNDAEAMRYYCGVMDEKKSTDDFCFVFDKAAIKHIIDKISEYDGIVLFQGARDMEDSMNEKGTTDVDGRPTLIIFPYVWTGKDDQKKMTVMLDDGSEHPGTGTGNPPPPPGGSGPTFKGFKKDIPGTIQWGSFHQK